MCLLDPKKISITEPVTCYKVVQVHDVDGVKKVFSPIMAHAWIPWYEDHDRRPLQIKATSRYEQIREYLGAEKVLFGGAYHACKTLDDANKFLKIIVEDRNAHGLEFAVGEFVIPTTSRFVYEGYHTYDNREVLGESLASEALTFVKLVE
ncbi:MAG: hypothetical protein J6Y37_02090 [Paludibacteraceae bacterium]|nr:hypothetical protein [Paludibacteraceae bacterium]